MVGLGGETFASSEDLYFVNVPVPSVAVLDPSGNATYMAKIYKVRPNS